MSAQSIEPNRDEAKNGWTAASLTEYYRQREKSAAIRVLGSEPTKIKRLLKVQRKFSPHRWRKGKAK